MTTDPKTSPATTPMHRAPGARRALGAIRAGSLAALIILVIQYALGVAEGLYGTMPSAVHSIGLFSGGPLLAIHGVLGILLAVSGISTAVRSVRTKHRPLAISSVIAMLALIAATMTGFIFLDKGEDGASLGMALAGGVAMICYGFNIWVLGHAHEAEPTNPDPHRPDKVKGLEGGAVAARFSGGTTPSGSGPGSLNACQ